MTDFEIVKLRPTDWKQFKEIRLNALKDAPQAFGASYDEEAKLSDEEWQKSLKNSEASNSLWYLFAKKGKELIGIVAAYTDKGKKVEHLANIGSVFVVPQQRGKGVAKKLMEELLKEIQKNPKIIKINLRVSSEQIAAVKLYESLGFKKVALMENELLIDGKFYDEWEMYKFIKSGV